MYNSGRFNRNFFCGINGKNNRKFNLQKFTLIRRRGMDFQNDFLGPHTIYFGRTSPPWYKMLRN